MPDWVIWILLALAFAATELATVSFFSSLFALGALVAAASTLFVARWPLQAIIFLVSSLCFVLLLRPLLIKLYDGERPLTNVDRLKGLMGSVIATVDNTEGSGQIKVEGQVWTARSLTGQVIPIDTWVEIVRIEGVKAVVKIKED